MRPYRPEDFRSLWEIDQSCFPPGISYTQFELKSYIRRSSSFTLVAEQQGPDAVQDQEGLSAPTDILGFLVAERTTRGRGHIITIDVRELGRRYGIGSALLNSAEQQLRAADCASIRLETAVDNIGALSFYKRHGYNVIKSIRGYYSTGVDALLLEKDLHSPLASR
ncbi:MAG TPA: N-acetyltransferase [Terriglobales bacterium]|nr:N-acetyltransferase [Terriglobales bacterium]